MNYRGTDYGLRSMSECEGHLFFPLLRDLVSTGSLRKDMIAQYFDAVLSVGAFLSGVGRKAFWRVRTRKGPR